MKISYLYLQCSKRQVPPKIHQYLAKEASFELLVKVVEEIPKIFSLCFLSLVAPKPRAKR